MKNTSNGYPWIAKQTMKPPEIVYNMYCENCGYYTEHRAFDLGYDEIYRCKECGNEKSYTVR